tara:strand:- start:141 stop:656 length:516 start_codon:yes stop_codon:yes gene_type:complete
MYQHEYDKRNAASIGNRAERVFVALANRNNFKVKPSTIYENKIKKVDFFLTKDNITKSFDVKARKKICAYDKSYNDDWTWVEFKNGDGFDGWLYGQADYIAFEKLDYFIVVDRISLKIMSEKLIDRKKEFVKSCSEAKYRIYQRRDQEEIGLIRTSDIKNIKRKAIWLKKV